MLSMDHIKHASLPASREAWSLVSLLPVACRGMAQGQVGTAPAGQTGLSLERENVPGLWKGLIHPQECSIQSCLIEDGGALSVPEAWHWTRSS